MTKYNSWPFVEARRLAQRTEDKDLVVFETGYGPSGLPHIGTFAEVARTTMVMNAFRELTGKKTRLICFSDDKDGLRSVPDNIPDRELLEAYLGYSLTSVPNPFDFTEYDGYPAGSFGEQNNARLRSFLDQYGFAYEFMSSTEAYRTPEFNNLLVEVAENVDEITAIVTSTMKEKRRKTYCPFMPIVNGVVIHDLYDWRLSRDTEGNPWMLHFFTEPADGPNGENRIAQMVSLFDGNCKLQWYVDWAMRWCALGVDYEMHGKDLLDSAHISSRIASCLGYEPPQQMMYELFLDERGEKISKSKGNGMDLGHWWHYSTRESLSYFMFQNPRKARKIHFDVIPQATEDYLRSLDRYQREPDQDNPVWHIHNGQVPDRGLPISFSMLLNLVSITENATPELITKYIKNYLPNTNLDQYPMLYGFVCCALNYYEDRVLPHKVYREPNDAEQGCLRELAQTIRQTASDHAMIDDAGEIFEQALTTAIYDLGKRIYGIENLRQFFGLFYEVIMGQTSGPRLPVFAMLYGPEKLADYIDQKLSTTR